MDTNVIARRNDEAIHMFEAINLANLWIATSLHYVPLLAMTATVPS